MGNHGVKKVIEFCYGHRLLDYDGKCQNLHGHNAQQDFGEPLYLMDGNPTAENITKLLFHTLSKLGLRVSRVSLWETPSGCATYSEG